MQEIYRNLLEEIKLMQLATCRDNKPWLCNVWFVMDKDDCVYWISRETRRHSEEVKLNPYVACTFHKWYESGLGEKGQSLVISGKAMKVSGKDCRMPYQLYADRYPEILKFQNLDAFLNDEGHHYFYKLIPEEIVWFDEVNYPDDPRQQIKNEVN